MESKRSKNIHRSHNKDIAICKKHPKHIQSLGVCAICLREKLSQISNTSHNNNNTRKNKNKNIVYSCSSSSLSSLSYYSSSDASSCLSPARRIDLSKGSSSSMAFLRSGKNVFMKSKSMAFVMQRQGDDVDREKKKRGFWAKLLRLRSKGSNEGLMHSRTTREKI